MSVIIVSALWCNACLYMKKVFKTFEKGHPELSFTYLDLDMDDEVERLNIGKVIPVVIFRNKDNEVFRITGECSLDDLERGLQDAIKI